MWEENFCYCTRIDCSFDNLKRLNINIYLAKPRGAQSVRGGGVEDITEACGMGVVLPS